MIKTRYINRTITITDYEVLLVNPINKEVTTCGFPVLGKLGDTHTEKDILNLATSTDLIPVSIISSKERTEHYRLSEDLFVEFGEQTDKVTPVIETENIELNNA